MKDELNHHLSESALGVGVGGPFTIVRLDTLDHAFGTNFEPYRQSFLHVLASAYDVYHGDAYHAQRIVNGRSIIYIALSDGEVVGASYVKRNLRRGGTVVHPGYQRRGIAEQLVRASIEDFPTQYSILSPSNTGMMRLLLKAGFRRAMTVDEVRAITAGEFGFLYGFVESDEGILFSRRSQHRPVDRELITLLFRRDMPDE